MWGQNYIEEIDMIVRSYGEEVDIAIVAM